MEKPEDMIKAFYEKNPYVKYLGIELVSLERARVKLAVHIAGDTHVNGYRVAHGGVLMSLADTAMGAACLTVDKKVVTLEMNMNCIKAVPENMMIYAIGQILHDGRHTVVAECEIIDKNGKLYAKSRGSFYIIDKFTE